MFKKVSKFLSLSLVCCIVGCVTPWKPSVFDLFQVPSTTRVYLNSNHWYNDPLNMNSFNVQKGNILPFGTEVVNVDFDDDTVKFDSVKDGVTYVIHLKKNYSMITMKQYVKRIFMVSNPAETELSIKPTVFEKIIRGVVEKGMTKDEVVIAYGQPTRHRTPSLKANTWIYYSSPTETKRVVFKRGVVTAVLNF